MPTACLRRASTFAWQWLQVDGGNETAISGARSKTYRVQATDAGKKFKVKVSFTDLDGHDEALTSAAYPADSQARAERGADVGEPGGDGGRGHVLQLPDGGLCLCGRGPG